MASVLTGPDDKKCWMCKALKETKPIHFGINYIIEDNKEILIESLIRYCPRCGAEIINENKYRKEYIKSLKPEHSYTFSIKGKIATKKLMKAMLDAEEKYYKEEI